MNIACLAEIANPVEEIPHVYCNPVTNFFVELPVGKELSAVVLWWEAPEEGSTGELEHFDVYRDSVMIATVEINPDPTYQYSYLDTITVGDSAEYFIMAVYSDGCEAPSQTEIGYGIDGIEESVSHVFVHPNPSNGTFNINLGKSQWNVEVYDIMGRKVYESRMEGNSIIDLGLYPKGLYFLKANNESRTLTAKMVLR